MGEKLAPRMVPITISGGTWNQSSDETREKYGIVGNYVLPGIPTGQLNSHQEPIFSQQAYTLRVDGTVDEHTYYLFDDVKSFFGIDNYLNEAENKPTRTDGKIVEGEDKKPVLTFMEEQSKLKIDITQYLSLLRNPITFR